SAFSKVSKEINDDAEDREDLLDDAKELIEEAGDLLDGVSHKIHNASGSTYPAVSVIDDIRAHHVTYTDELETIEEANNEESGDDDENGEEEDGKSIEDMQEDTRKFKRDAIDLLDSLISTAKSADEKLQEAMEL